MIYTEMLTNTGLLDPQVWSDQNVWTAALETSEARRRGSRGKGGGSWVVGLVCLGLVVVGIGLIIWLSARKKNNQNGQGQLPQQGNGGQPYPPQQPYGGQQQYPAQQQYSPQQQYQGQQPYPGQQQQYQQPYPGQQYPQQQQQQQPYTPQQPYPVQQQYPPQQPYQH
ncbi:hypothetical protein [Nocardia sp. CS682]|uniref:hypothetical protein n=1 Tax=Nocardia sp. CS682 TaxID=1047172 RepID=UPI0019816FA9|nr:hypothetical protein [Nocardia sp. CS682]